MGWTKLSITQESQIKPLLHTSTDRSKEGRMSGLQARTTPPEFWAQEWVVCTLTASPWHETDSCVSHWGKSGRLSYKDFLPSAPPLSIPSAGWQLPDGPQVNLYLESGLGESLPSEPCREGACQHHSMGPWHIYSSRDGSLPLTAAALASLAQFHLQKTTQPDILTPSDRWKHAASSCHLPAPSSFRVFRGHSSVIPIIILLLYSQFINIPRNHSFIPLLFQQTLLRVSQGLVTHPVIAAPSQARSPIRDLMEFTSLTLSIWVASWSTGNLWAY